MLQWKPFRSILKDRTIMEMICSVNKLFILPELWRKFAPRSKWIRMSDDLRYGLRDEKIILASEILPEENGNACNCCCPNCKGALQARTQGYKQKAGMRKPYFAHQRNPCDAQLAGETGLHMLAKELLTEAKELLFPAYAIAADDPVVPDVLRDWEKEKFPHLITKSRKLKLDSVTVEVRDFEGVIPDGKVIVKGTACYVEIGVTHFVDQEKREKLDALGIPVFEIDLRDMIDRETDRDEIREALLNTEDNRKWIVNPKLDQERDDYIQALMRRLGQLGTGQEAVSDSTSFIGKSNLPESRYVCDICNQSFVCSEFSLYGGVGNREKYICKTCARKMK